jgi:hypothetical protein
MKSMVGLADCEASTSSRDAMLDAITIVTSVPIAHMMKLDGYTCTTRCRFKSTQFTRTAEKFYIVAIALQRLCFIPRAYVSY